MSFFRVNEKSSNNTISTATLTIAKVSTQDFNTGFKCIGEGQFRTLNTILTLKRRGQWQDYRWARLSGFVYSSQLISLLSFCFPESIIPLVIAGVCVFVFFVLTAVLVKRFAIDLALFFRPYLPLSRYKKGTEDTFFNPSRIMRTKGWEFSYKSLTKCINFYVYCLDNSSLNHHVFFISVCVQIKLTCIFYFLLKFYRSHYKYTYL